MTRRDAIKQAVMHAMTHARTRAPLLWGPTGAGKTYLATEIARELDADILYLYLATQNPHEICGFPIEVDGQIRWALPEWARTVLDNAAKGKRTVLFLDEVGQAANAGGSVVSTLYGLIRGNKLLNVEMPARGSEWYIIGATNPFDMDGGLRTRVLTFHVVPEREDLIEVAGDHAMARLLATTAPVEPTETWASREWSPEPPPDAEWVTAAEIAAARELINPAFYGLSADAQRLILRSFLPAAAVDTMMQRIDPSWALADPNFVFQVYEQVGHNDLEMVGYFEGLLQALTTADDTARLRGLLAITRFQAYYPTFRRAWYEAPLTAGLESFFRSCDSVAERFAGILERHGIYYEENGELKGELIDASIALSKGETPTVKVYDVDPVTDEPVKDAVAVPVPGKYTTGRAGKRSGSRRTK
jgi:hypothetical protein